MQTINSLLSIIKQLVYAKYVKKKGHNKHKNTTKRVARVKVVHKFYVRSYMMFANKKAGMNTIYPSRPVLCVGVCVCVCMCRAVSKIRVYGAGFP